MTLAPSTKEKRNYINNVNPALNQKEGNLVKNKPESKT